MRVCLKCQAFYDDDNVKFCLNDGDPLLNMDQTHDLWEKGTEAIRETRRTVSKQIRRQKLTKVVSITVTTVLTVMIVSLAALNSYIYLNPEEKEVAQATQPDQAPGAKTFFEPQATPGIAKTPDTAASPTPSTKIETPSPIMTAMTPRPPLTPAQQGAAPPPPPQPLPLPLPPTPTPAPPETPTDRPVNGRPNQPPALEPVATIDLPDVSPPARAPSPIPAPTTDVGDSPPLPATPTSIKTPGPSGCSVKDKLGIEQTIKNRFTSEWEKEIAASGEDTVLRKQFSWQKFVAFRNTSAALRSPVDVVVKSSKNCKKADVKIKYEWRVGSPKKQKEYGGVHSYQCSKNGDDWGCQKKSQRLFCIPGV